MGLARCEIYHDHWSGGCGVTGDWPRFWLPVPAGASRYCQRGWRCNYNFVAGMITLSVPVLD